MIRNRMKEHRARLGLKQEELAKLVGVRRETIGNLEKGRYNPSLVLACVAMVVVSLATPAPDSETLDVWFGVGRSCVKGDPART